MHESYLVAIW